MSHSLSEYLRRRWLARTAMLAAGVVTLLGTGPITAGTAFADTAAHAPHTSTAASGYRAPSQAQLSDGERQAALVATEDHRLVAVQTLTAVAKWRDHGYDTPFRFDTGTGYTLVLTPRATPYTVQDLLVLAPETFIREPDGSYLLSESIYLAPGAALKLEAPGMVLRLRSDSQGFVSIISDGGYLELGGTRSAPMTITSWDSTSARPDTSVTDGRAYIRAIGGQFTLQYAKVAHLGFWSGRTGGVALTGTDRPLTGALEKAKAGRQPSSRKVSQARSKAARGQQATDLTGYLSAQLGMSARALGSLGMSYVSGYLGHVTIDDDAFGLFVSGATGVSVADSTVERSRFDGVLLHRYVRGAVVERVTSTHNGGDGFLIARAAEGIKLSSDTASYNAGNGFTMNGRPLSTGASAAGMPMRSYGGNLISGSTAQGNRGNGIEILGGLNSVVEDNHVTANKMGIVVREGAEHMTVSGNEVSDEASHGISIREGSASAEVTGNTVASSATGIYLRNSSARIRGNTVKGGDEHAISLVGRATGTTVEANTVSGAGGSAIDSGRATGQFTVANNKTARWIDLRSWTRKLRHLFTPMTILWLFVLAVVVFGAVRGRRRGRHTGHPYPHRSTQTLVLPEPRTEAE